jgi:hypothetical protein
MPDVTLRSFPVGAKVKLHRRHGDEFVPGSVGKDVSSATVDKHSNVKLSADPGEYWATDGESHAAVFIADKDGGVPRHPAETPAQTHPQTIQPRVIVEGPRGTAVVNEGAGDRVVHEKPSAGEVEPAPHAHQASLDAKTPQRSSTALGQATPTVPSEPQPKPRQEDVGDKTPQRSDTETGEASLVGDEDAQPALRQEDVKGNVKQRSDTETGEASRVGLAEPRGTASNPTSLEQASGDRPTDAKSREKEVKAQERVVKKATKK